MPPLGRLWHSLLAKHGTVWKQAYTEAVTALETKLSGRVPAQIEHACARVPARQSVHPIARIRQGQSGWLNSKARFASAVRYFTTQSKSKSVARGFGYSTTASQTATWQAIRHSSGRAPFASTLRPNLTGGTLGRTAGGYGLGGGRAGAQRYFSHGPSAPTQVVQNVSQAVRAFVLGGQKAQFNGAHPVTGEKRFKAVTTLQDQASRKVNGLARTTPGSHVEFGVNPTLTALTSLRGTAGFQSQDEQHLNTEGLLDVLSTDFSRSLQELCVVLGDLKRLSVLGDLPITYENSTLRIHFPGCDADTVERLCHELNVRRGIVVQDEDFDAYTGTEMALLFPFAPGADGSEPDDMFSDHPAPAAVKGEQIDWQNMLTPSTKLSDYSTRSEQHVVLEEEDESIWLSDASDDALAVSSIGNLQSSAHSPLEYQGIEGIYRFIEQCDSSRRL